MTEDTVARRSSELVFQVLERDPSADIATLPAGVTRPDGLVLLGRDAEGRRHLLIPLPEDYADVSDLGSTGVRVRARDLTDAEGTRRSYIDIECGFPHLDRVFATLADDLLAELASSQAAAGAICRATIDRWRELLSPVRRERMTRGAEMGLLAELLLLERAVRAGNASALQSWTGWESSRIDFRAAGVAVEVKASLTREHRTFIVDGLQQLEPPPGAQLTVALFRFEATPDGTECLPDVLARLVVAGVPRAELMRRVASRGWGDQDEYERFAVTEVVSWPVDERFPRVTSASFGDGVPVGVSEVTYRLTLDGLEPMSPASLEATLSGLSDR